MSGRYGPLKSTTTIIGTQTWMQYNLDVTKYRDGTIIPEVQDPTAWAALTTGAWCYYDNNPANGAIYGKLYNWYAVNNPRGLAPVGYHVPSRTEFDTLSTYLGGQLAAGGPLKEVGTTHWIDPNVGATNTTNFTGLPGGVRSYYDGSFAFITQFGIWWSSYETDTPGAYCYTLRNDGNTFILSDSDQPNGFSVRCLKD